MLLLGIDFETTGLDFERDRITEVGAVLWDTAQRAPVRILNELILHRDAPPITAEIEGLTGITQGMLESHGRRPEVVFTRLVDWLNLCDAAVAHNGAGFDRPMLESQMRRFESDNVNASLAAAYPRGLDWIDTCMDVEFPPTITTRKLVHLAAEHGFLNPFAHRAVFDVLTMLKVLDGYPVETVLESARQPMKTLVARVSFDDREKAKARGYRWRAEGKLWVKHLKAHKVESEAGECRAQGFEISVRDFNPLLK